MRIIYLDIDSLRPDHLGCYGYHRNTSQNLDQLASEGVCFDRLYATDTPCLPSRTAFFTGKFGIHSGVVNHGGLYADLPHEGKDRRFVSVNAQNALAERLRKAGWHTASISPFPHRHTAYHIWYGFHEMYDTAKNGNDLAEDVYPQLEEWLERNKDRDQWFLHTNFWDPHTLYDTPAEYGEHFKDDPPPAWLTQEKIDEHRASYGPHDATDPLYNQQRKIENIRGTPTIKNLKDWKKWIDGYDTAVHYVDYYVGKLIDKLKALGIYDDTAIVISADHGENQGELNIYGDHQTADEICHRLPCIIKWPGLTDDKAGQHFKGFHYNVDLAATILELAGGQIPEVWDGESFGETLKDGTDRGHDFLVLSQGAWSCQRSTRWDDYILIRTYHAGNKNFPELMLFNLKEDPHEQNNLAESRPDLVGYGLKRMDQWVAEQLKRSGQPDPLHAVIAEGGPLHANDRNVKPMIEHCRATGREEHAQWLEQHGPGKTH